MTRVWCCTEWKLTGHWGISPKLCQTWTTSAAFVQIGPRWDTCAVLAKQVLSHFLCRHSANSINLEHAFHPAHLWVRVCWISQSRFSSFVTHAHVTRNRSCLYWVWFHCLHKASLMADSDLFCYAKRLSQHQFMCNGRNIRSRMLMSPLCCRASFVKGMYWWKWVDRQKPSSNSTIA